MSRQPARKVTSSMDCLKTGEMSAVHKRQSSGNAGTGEDEYFFSSCNTHAIKK